MVGKCGIKGGLGSSEASDQFILGSDTTVHRWKSFGQAGQFGGGEADVGQAFRTYQCNTGVYQCQDRGIGNLVRSMTSNYSMRRSIAILNRQSAG